MTDPYLRSKQDPNKILDRAYSNWQQRVSTPKGNPNIPKNIDINFTKQNQYQNTLQAQYQMYYQQCLASGQAPMSQIQFMQTLQQNNMIASDPATQLQTGMALGKSFTDMISGLFNIGKSSKAETSGTSQGKGPTEAQQQMVNNYQTALETGGEFTINNLNDFVNAEFAHMNAKGDTVTQEQFVNYMTNLGFDKAEAVAIAKAMDTSNSDFSSDNTISKKEVTSFYKSVMGNSNSISAQKLEAALTASADKTDQKLNNDTKNTDEAMKAKGYTSTTQIINGEITGVYVKGDEVIPWNDPKIETIINGTGE